MPAGRPSSYSEAIADEILERIASGEPLTKICRDDHMPCVATVFNWEKSQPGFMEKVTRARELSADHFSHEIIEISDENPIAVTVGDDWSRTSVDAAGVQRNRLRIDTRIKLMQMLKRKTYGDKTPGDSAENPLHLKINREEALAKLIGPGADPPTAESQG